MILPLLIAAAILPRAYDGGMSTEGYTPVPAPSVAMRMNEATATRVPWIEANGWRFERGLKKAFYAKVPKGAAALAAAEAFVYGVDAIIEPASGDAPALNRMLAMLKTLDLPTFPSRANIGVIDDGSDATGEVLNLLGRRNLLYRVVKSPEPGLDLTVRPDKNDAADPNLFAAKIREKVSDEKRLVRVYGSYVVIARLTANQQSGRLYLLNYGRQPARDVRIRVLGPWKSAGPAVADVESSDGAIEFSLPEIETLAAIDLSTARTIESLRMDMDRDLTADPGSEHWKSAPAVQITKDFLGAPIPGPATEVRSRWTGQNLYLLFTAPYASLNLKPQPQTSADTVPLWDWDVVEAFLGSDFQHIGRYFEFEVSPQGEWVDLEIDRDHPKDQKGAAWNSGFAVKARVDGSRRVWYAEMRIPFQALNVQSPVAGQQLRAGLYRCGGRAPQRTYYAWSPTGKRTFHAPESFGILRLR